MSLQFIEDVQKIACAVDHADDVNTGTAFSIDNKKISKPANGSEAQILRPRIGKVDSRTHAGHGCEFFESIEGGMEKSNCGVRLVLPDVQKMFVDIPVGAAGAGSGES